MNSIESDFFKKEIGSLLILFALMASALFLLCYLGDLELKWVGLAAAVAAAAVLRLFTTAKGDFKARWENLNRPEQEKILAAYEGAHSILPVYQGELHILPDCLVWRSRRRLALVLAEDIERVKLVQLDKVCDVVFYMKENKKYKLEFLLGQSAGVQKTVDWLRGLAGALGRKIEIEGA